MQGENQPTMPGQPSQPLYGQPGPYSQPMGQPGPYSQPMGYPGGPSVAPPQQKRSLKWLWITLAVVAGLLVVGGGGGVFALSLYAAPGAAASQFCGYLKAQNYDSAYSMLSAKLKGAYTADQFRQGNVQLDAAEGKVTACGAAQGSGAYDYSLGSNKATVTAVLTRGTQGNLQGGVHLVNESGWKVDGLDTPLLGVNLGALGTLNAFCGALKAQNYTTAFGLLSSSAQTKATEVGFTALETLQDQVDGRVTDCALKSVPAGNTDTTTKVGVTITRATKGASSGNVTLEGSGGVWKISDVDDSAQGTNLQPLLIGTLFCGALALNTPTGYATAYTLTSADFQKVFTQTEFATDLATILHTLSADAKWVGCTPDLTTYKVTGSKAQYSAKLNAITGTGAKGYLSLKFVLVQEATVWKIDEI